MAAMTGWGDGPQGRHDPAHVLHGPHAHPVAAHVLGPRGHPGVLQLEAGAEGPAGAGEDDHPAAVVGGHLVQGVVEVRHQGEGERVEPGRIVERHRPGRGRSRIRRRRVPWPQPHRTGPPAPLIAPVGPSSRGADGSVQPVRALRRRRPTRTADRAPAGGQPPPGRPQLQPTGDPGPRPRGPRGPRCGASTAPGGWRSGSCCRSGTRWPPRPPSCSPGARWPATPSSGWSGWPPDPMLPRTR